MPARRRDAAVDVHHGWRHGAGRGAPRIGAFAANRQQVKGLAPARGAGAGFCSAVRRLRGAPGVV